MCVSLCVFVIRIGELREVMDDILRKQCDYDPASGESYDFDRFVSRNKANSRGEFDVIIGVIKSHL